MAWVLVRDEFRGKAFVNALIDLPFALPTIVAGLTLLALYGPRSPIGVDVAFTQVGRRDGAAVRHAAVRHPLGAARAASSSTARWRRPPRRSAPAASRPSGAIIFPNLVPAILSGAALAFSRAVGEFGSIILLSGNIPFETQVSSVYAFKQIESDNLDGAAAVSVVLLLVALPRRCSAIRGLERWRA